MSILIALPITLVLADGLGIAEESDTQESDLGKLLQDAEETLESSPNKVHKSGPEGKIKPAPSGKGTAPNAVGKPGQTPQQHTSTPNGQKPDGVSSAVSPESAAELSEILRADRKALTHEQSDPSRAFSAQFALGRLTTRGYRLKKDDDAFTVTDGTHFNGLKVALVPVQWLFSDTHSYWSRAPFGPKVGIGYFSGSVPVSRTGVEEGRASYAHQHIIADLAMRFAIPLMDRLQAALSLGLAADVLRQEGSGVNDTVLQTWTGDLVELSLLWELTRSVSVFGEWSTRGLISSDKDLADESASAGSGTMTVGLHVSLGEKASTRF